MLPLTVSASATTTDRSQKVEGSASVYQGCFEHEGDQKPIYLLELKFDWNGRICKISSWSLDSSGKFSDECVKSIWEEFTRGMAYQSGTGLSRYLKDEAKAKEGLELHVPFVAEDLFSKVLEQLKRKMENLYPAPARTEIVDPIATDREAAEA